MNFKKFFLAVILFSVINQCYSQQATNGVYMVVSSQLSLRFEVFQRLEQAPLIRLAHLA